MSIIKSKKFIFVTKLITYASILIVSNITYNYIGLLKKNMLTKIENNYLLIKIVGPVKNPGLYSVNKNIDLNKLINISGGLNKKYILKKNISITNNQVVNMFKYIKKNNKYLEFDYFNYIKKKW